MGVEDYYCAAVVDPSLCGRFVRSLDWGFMSPFVSNVITGMNLTTVMECHPHCRGDRSVIFVGSSAFSFDLHPCFADFYSTLVYHEGYHAKEFLERYEPLHVVLSLVDQIDDPLHPIFSDCDYSPLSADLGELRAYRHQAIHFTSSHSRSFTQMVHQRIKQRIRALKDSGLDELASGICGTPL